MFNFFHNEEVNTDRLCITIACVSYSTSRLTCTAEVQEDSFHLVDNRPDKKKQGQRRFNPQRFAHRNTQFNRGQPEQPHQARQKQAKQRQFQNFHRDNQRVSCSTSQSQCMSMTQGCKM